MSDIKAASASAISAPSPSVEPAPTTQAAQDLAFRLIDDWLGLGPDGAAHVREQLAALAGTTPPLQVEPGWVMVPVEPTEDMLALLNPHLTHTPYSRYKALIAACAKEPKP